VRPLPPWTIPIATGLLATAPDLDLAMRRLFHYRASSMFSHRGFFHSPFFLILAAALLAAIVAHLSSRQAFPRQTFPGKTFAWLWLLFAGCLLSHPLMDSMTDGGYGVMLFAPFKRTRLYLPWRPIFTPPRGETLLRRAWVLRRTELPFCAAALLIGLSGVWILGRGGPRGGQESPPEGE